MKTLREAYGSETKFTHQMTVEEAIKVCIQCGLPTNIDRVVSEKSLTDSRVDVVFYTTKGEAILYEHMAMGKDLAEADRPHVDKTMTYPRLFEIEHPGVKVLASILACEGIKPQFKQILDDNREKEYERRPRANGAKNTQVIKSQWTDDGVYEPVRFDDKEIGQVKSNTIQHPRWNELHYIYMPYNLFQREDYKKANKDAITYWYWIDGLPRKYKAYFHELAGYIEVGLHCEPFTQEDEEFLQKIKPSEDWDYRNTAAGKRTISKKFPLDIDNKTLAREAQELHISIRKALTFA